MRRAVSLTGNSRRRPDYYDAIEEAGSVKSLATEVFPFSGKSGKEIHSDLKGSDASDSVRIVTTYGPDALRRKRIDVEETVNRTVGHFDRYTRTCDEYVRDEFKPLLFRFLIERPPGGDGAFFDQIEKPFVNVVKTIYQLQEGIRRSFCNVSRETDDDNDKYTGQKFPKYPDTVYDESGPFDRSASLAVQRISLAKSDGALDAMQHDTSVHLVDGEGDMGLLGDYLDSLPFRKASVKRIRRDGSSATKRGGGGGGGRISEAFSGLRAANETLAPKDPLLQRDDKEDEPAQQEQEKERRSNEKLKEAKTVGNKNSDEGCDYLTGEEEEGEEEEEETEDSEEEESSDPFSITTDVMTMAATKSTTMYTGSLIDHPSVLDWDWD